MSKETGMYLLRYIPMKQDKERLHFLASIFQFPWPKWCHSLTRDMIEDSRGHFKGQPSTLLSALTEVAYFMWNIQGLFRTSTTLRIHSGSVEWSGRMCTFRSLLAILLICVEQLWDKCGPNREITSEPTSDKQPHYQTTKSMWLKQINF